MNLRPSKSVVSGLLLAAPLAIAFALAPGAVAAASPARSAHLALAANVDCVSGHLGTPNPLKLPECLGD